MWREYIWEHEQHRLSGYTEKPIRLDSSHIDHFRKQSLFHTLVFDWPNLIVDGIDETYGAKFKDGFIKNASDNEKLIDPVKEDAARFFKYELSGKISVADNLNDVDKARAAFTIEAFNLNEGSLKECRKRIMNIIWDSYRDLSDEMIVNVLEAEGFRSVVEQVLKERKIEDGL